MLLPAIHHHPLSQADLQFKNEERDKSEATAKTLGDGEWCGVGV